MPFIDRVDAGHRLACRLQHLRDDPVVVLGLPRGGVPVAYEVAADLGAPLDVILVRKLGVPFQPELAMGAIGEGGVRVLNEKVIAAAGVKANEFAAVEERERRELERRAARLRNGHVRTTVHGKTAVLVDDGMATGSTAFAACQVARRLGAMPRRACRSGGARGDGPNRGRGCRRGRLPRVANALLRRRRVVPRLLAGFG